MSSAETNDDDKTDKTDSFSAAALLLLRLDLDLNHPLDRRTCRNTTRTLNKQACNSNKATSSTAPTTTRQQDEDKKQPTKQFYFLPPYCFFFVSTSEFIHQIDPAVGAAGPPSAPPFHFAALRTAASALINNMRSSCKVK
jgi:hypothetical protein